MKKDEYFDEAYEKRYEPIINHFSQGNAEEPSYDKSILNHDDDYPTYDYDEGMKHFSDD